MIAEMRMQMGQPALALLALNRVMTLYPNRFNSIAAAAAAAAALESSSAQLFSSSQTPSASYFHAQLLALASSAQALRDATTSFIGKTQLMFMRRLLLMLLLLSLPFHYRQLCSRNQSRTGRLRCVSCADPPSWCRCCILFLQYSPLNVLFLLPTTQLSQQQLTSNQASTPVPHPPPSLPLETGLSLQRPSA